MPFATFCYMSAKALRKHPAPHGDRFVRTPLTGGMHPEIVAKYFCIELEKKLQEHAETFYCVARPKPHQLNVFSKTPTPANFWKRAAEKAAA